MDKRYKINYVDRSEKVYQALKEMILKNELKSGQKLNQEKISQMLGVSRTPVLSAFSKLEKEMLIEIKPRRGAYVKKLSIKEFIELYEIRMRLESLGAYEAAKNATEKEIEQLKLTLDSFINSVNQGTRKYLMEKDYYLHMKIMEMSKNTLLFRIISSFNIIIISNMEGLLKPAEQSMDEHKQMFDAIRNHDAGLSEKLMYNHILDSRNRLSKRLAEEEPPGPQSDAV